MRYVICIDVRGTDGMLQLNRTYEALERVDGNYFVTDLIKGYVGVFPSNRFSLLLTTRPADEEHAEEH